MDFGFSAGCGIANVPVLVPFEDGVALDDDDDNDVDIVAAGGKASNVAPADWKAPKPPASANALPLLVLATAGGGAAW